MPENTSNDQANSPKPTLEERAKHFTEELNFIKKKYGVEFKFGIDFPVYREIPPAAQLATMVITDHKGIITLQIIDKK